MIKTNIKMRVTPEQSAKVQKICFKNGIYWDFSEDIIKNEDKPYIFIAKTSFSSNEIGNKLTEEEQWAKLALVKEIAKEVWG